MGTAVTGWEDLPSLTGTDEQARRVCSLAVAFSSASRPIPSPELHAAHYPDLSEDSFARAFRRDRERLAACGIVVRGAEGADGERRWAADGASFAGGATLSVTDTLLLCALCQQLVDDEAFPYRFELRHALAKVGRAYGGAGAVRLEAGRRAAAPALARMLRCLANRQPVRIEYVDASGHASRRVVAPYGSFGLRGALYLVCSAVGDGGAPTQDLRTFRADRVSAAEPLDGHFEVPEDFSVDDYVLLPFQIGPSVGKASFLVPAGAEAEMIDQARRCGAFPTDDGPSGAGVARGRGLTWTVPMSDVTAAASWAVAAGIEPLAPPELVSRWRSVLAGAAHTLRADAASAAGSPVTRGRGKDGSRVGGRGRREGLDDIRELLALVAALDHEGDSVTADAVAARLGVSHERASVLLDLLLMVGGDGSYLPLSATDDDESLVLAFGGGLHGRPLRLTGPETHALVAALDLSAVAEDDPLRQAVLAAFRAPDVTEADVRRSLAACADASAADALAVCARAIVDGADLAFSYRGTCDAVARERRVTPLRLAHREGRWYLEAHDLDRAAERSFRLDRMTDVSARPSGGGRAETQPPPVPDAREAIVAFTDGGYLTSLDWPGLHIVSSDRANGVTVATLPWYGGTWLPRHLAACGGAARPADPELLAAVHEAARTALDGRGDMP